MKATPIKPFFLWSFWGVLALDIFMLLYGYHLGHTALKPFLMPLLMAWLAANRHFLLPKDFRYLIAALLFSWIGDLALMLDGKPIFFMLGLGSFLIAHINYGLFFSQRIKPPFPFFIWLTIVVFLLYGFGLVSLLWPSLGGLRIPVLAYAIILVSMLSMALLTRNGVAPKAWVYMLLGAFSFVISDSLLAFQKFLHPITNGAAWVMLTYGLAQGLIVRGALRSGQVEK